MKSKIILKILIGLFLYFILSFSFKLYTSTYVSDKCLNSTFNNQFEDLSSLKINSTYDFDNIFDCEPWNEILITDAHYYMRSVGYLYSGVLVPSYDPFQYFEGTYLIYFLKNNIIVSNPVELHNNDFIFSAQSYKNSLIKIKREDAKFVYKKFEHSDYDLTTLELIEDIE